MHTCRKPHKPSWVNYIHFVHFFMKYCSFSTVFHLQQFIQFTRFYHTNHHIHKNISIFWSLHFEPKSLQSYVYTLLLFQPIYIYERWSEVFDTNHMTCSFQLHVLLLNVDRKKGSIQLYFTPNSVLVFWVPPFHIKM